MNLTPNKCVPLYLVHSYLYYKLDCNIIPDEQFDLICKKLLSEWDTITHKHKKYINKESLEAGSGFDIDFNNLPNITIQVAIVLSSGVDYEGNSIDIKEWMV